MLFKGISLRIDLEVDIMPDFEMMYFQLYANISSALEALESNDPEKAREILIFAQLQGEEADISGD